ncbi:MAG: NAD-dependent protein deacetylase [Nitriliruptorales bacterium]|nr:NAD-dependent protein deacetylase [Nitriliruptorales bacterium]
MLGDVLDHGRVLILSGAGISTDSGIPDYRGASGRTRHAAPMTYDRFVNSAADRRRYWARSHIGWEKIASAKPNVSHDAVSRLQRAGRLSGVVTQNVDGLHTRAGTADVIDLHGRLDTVACLRCGTRRPRFELALRLDAVNPGFREAMAADVSVARPDGDLALPDDATDGFRVIDCRRCGGMLKPDVVFFGETVPGGRFRKALGLVDRSDALVVLGSSLTVGSGYRFVTAAARRRIPIAIVNRGATRGDRHATIKLDMGLAEALRLVRVRYTSRLAPSRRESAANVARPMPLTPPKK